MQAVLRHIKNILDIQNGRPRSYAGLPFVFYQVLVNTSSKQKPYQNYYDVVSIQLYFDYFFIISRK